MKPQGDMGGGMLIPVTKAQWEAYFEEKRKGKPRLLDLFCCEGGAAKGYADAGFDVIGVDIVDQLDRYPFEFVWMNALDYLRAYRVAEMFDAVHASPPCQSYSRNFKHLAKPQPMLIDAVRDALKETGLPYVIENVEGSGLPDQSDLFGAHGVVLCGSSFGKRIWRHRWFETNFPVPALGCQHRGHAMNPHNVAGRERIYEQHGRQDPEKLWAKEMGVEWMSRHGAREAVPPCMTEYIGTHLMAHLSERKAAAA